MFTVTALDQSIPPRTAKSSVGVIVDDVNDNPPHFTQSQYHHRVADTFPAGTTVATPFAFDMTDSEQAVYEYSLEGHGSGIYFRIDPESGVVTTTEALSNSIAERLRFSVVAVDRSVPSLMALAELVVDISHTVQGTKCITVDDEQ